MKCLAIDDEPLALDVIKDFVEKTSFLNLKATCNNALEALELIQNEGIDLIFLDINMPNISGIEFLKSLKNAPLVIFTTAYSEHALEGFELDAIDYLVKPIAFDRFIKAVNKAYEIYTLYNYKYKEFGASTIPENDFIFVNAEYSTVKINLNEILFIEGLKDYIKIYNGPRPILTLCSMKKMENKLPSNQFIRVHKSFIVSIHHINAIERNFIVMGEKKIPIGETYKEAFYNRINDFKL